MKTFIWFELKQIFRNIKVWFLMLIIIVIGIVMVQDYNAKAAIGYNNLLVNVNLLINNVYNKTLNEDQKKPEKFSNKFPYYTEEQLHNAVAMYEGLSERGINAKEAYFEKNWHVYNEQLAYYNYLNVMEKLWFEAFDSARNEKETIYQSIIDHTRQQAINENYPELYLTPIAYEARDKEDIVIAVDVFNRMRHYHLLSKSNLMPLNQYSITSMTFPYIFIDRFGFIFIAFVVLALLHDHFGKDRENGSIKTLISMPDSRKWYMPYKIVSGYIASIIVVTLPMLIISILLGISDGFRTWKYPVLAHLKGFTSFKGIPDNAAYDMLQHGYNRYIGISKFSSYPATPKWGIHMDLEFISLWQFMLVAISIMSLFIFLIVLINAFTSSLIKNKMLVLIVNLCIALVGIVLTQIFNGSFWNLINPFAYSNPIAIVGGYGSYTALTAFAVLTVEIITLYVLSKRSFFRIEI